MDTPLVTVILTVCNRTHYLEQAIRSVVAQTLRSWECIITDDSNSRAVREICALFSSDPRLRYRANPKTLGAPLNVAAALREARGTYVAILNDDDLLEPTMLETLACPLETSPNVTLAFGNYKIIDSKGDELPQATSASLLRRGREALRRGPVQAPFEFAVRRNVMAVIGCLFRKNACSSRWFTEEVRGAYDFWLAIQLAGLGDLYFEPATVMAWRQHGHSVSARHSKDIFRAEIFIYRALLDQTLDNRTLTHVRRQLAHFQRLRGKELLAHWEAREAREALRNSLRTKFSFLGLLLWFLTFLPKVAVRALVRGWHQTIQFRTHCGLVLFRAG